MFTEIEREDSRGGRQPATAQKTEAPATGGAYLRNTLHHREVRFFGP
jgi:hypothetical protein